MTDVHATEIPSEQEPDATAPPTTLMDASTVEAEQSQPGETAYEFKTPEGMQLDDAAASEWAVAARELGLDQSAAQKAVDIVANMVRRQQESQSRLVASWAEQSQGDTEIGGDRLQENLGVARKALEMFGTPELRDVLNMTGLGNHPEIIRAFYRAGKAISEDAFVSGSPRRADDMDAAKRMFPTMN